MTITIFNPNNWAEYEKWFSRYLSERDIYYNPAFLKCEASLLEGEPNVYLSVDSEGRYFVYPFIKKQIPVSGFEQYYDITSPYGYCGPVTNTDNQDFFLKAEEGLCSYLTSQHVVNEFVRYHYLYNQNSMFRLNIQNSLNRRVVVVDTSQTWDKVWAEQYSTTNRNLVRKMEKEGYTFRFTEDLNLYREFIQMYYRTMDNAKADTSYYFSENYFLDLKNALSESLKFGIVEKEGVLFSAALFYVTPGIATYYLSARNLDYPKVPGVNFLLSKALEAFQETSVSSVNLGGGTTNDPGNSLFKFKLNFSKNTSDFWVGKRIHLPEVYEKLKSSFIDSFGGETFQQKAFILQFYR